METIKHHLAHNLPIDIFSLAVANSTETKLGWIIAENKALENAFHWLSAPEGFEFWKAVNEKYFLMKDDTLIPTPENINLIIKAKEEANVKACEILNEVEFADDENEIKAVEAVASYILSINNK